MRQARWEYKEDRWTLRDINGGMLYAFIWGRPDPGGMRPAGWKYYEFEIQIPSIGCFKGGHRSSSAIRRKAEKLLAITYLEFDNEEFEVVP